MKSIHPFAFGCLLFAALSVESSAQTLLVRYTFDEGSGTSVADSGTGVSSVGTLGGNATWSTNTPGGTGSSLGFTKNGTDANFVTASAAEVDGLGSFTITLWLNVQGAISNGDRLVSTLSAATFKGFDFNLQSVTGSGASTTFNPALLVDGNTGPSAFVGTASINANSQWVFLAVTYDGTKTSNNVAFYTGSVSSSSLQLGILGTINMGAVDATTGALQIANTSASASDRTPTALFDDVRIYGGVADAAFIEGVRISAVPEPASFAGVAGAATLLAVGFARRRRPGRAC